MLTPDSSGVASPPAGWYGKLPVLGDFAQRRLPPEFVEPWDAWLAAGLADWQSRDEGWLDQYLAGSTWRFILSPGVIGPSTWAGVLIVILIALFLAAAVIGTVARMVMPEAYVEPIMTEAEAGAPVHVIPDEH